VPTKLGRAMSDLNQLLDFIKFTHQIRKIERAVVLDNEHHENDAEHQYQMSLTALFIIEENNLKLDKYKCMALGAVHDVIEVFSGDLIVFAPKADIAAKELKEKEAANQLKAKWPSSHTLHKLIEEYEEHETPEGKFVYALDKLLPEINNYLYGGKAWKKHGITYEQVKVIKKGKIDIDPTINDYHKQILKTFEQHPEIFGSPK
jgi:putative hydrolase of HD superfamily